MTDLQEIERLLGVYQDGSISDSDYSKLKSLACALNQEVIVLKKLLSRISKERGLRK